MWFAVLLPAIYVEAVHEVYFVIQINVCGLMFSFPAILVEAVHDVDVVVQINACWLMFSYLRYLSRLFMT
jgi:hypothetical protein